MDAKETRTSPFDLEEFTNAFNQQYESFEKSIKKSPQKKRKEKPISKDKNYMKQKMTFESNFKLHINSEKKNNVRKTLDPNFFTHSKLGKLFKNYFSRNSGEYSSVNAPEGTKISNPKLQKLEERTETKLRHSVNLTEIFKHGSTNMSPIKTISTKNEKTTLFSPRDAKTIERQPSDIIETVTVSTNKKEDFDRLFLTAFNELPNTETEYTIDDDLESSNDKTFGDVIFDDEDVDDQNDDEEDDVFDHPDVFKFMKNKTKE